MRKNYYITTTLTFAFSMVFLFTSALQAQVALPWMDNFDGYANGTVLDGTGAHNGWLGWGGSAAAAGTVSNLQSSSVPHSIEIEGGDDAIAWFTPVTTGQWAVEAKMFIPGNLVGGTYFILLNQYDHPCFTCNWSVQVQFNGGIMADEGAGGGTQAYIADQWVDIRLEIDLDADTQRFIYNGATFYSGVWNGYVTGAGSGSNALTVLDLFANGATQVFYDDISVTRFGLPVELSSFDAFVEDGKVRLDWTTLSEEVNSGFEVEMAQGDVFTQIGFVEGHGTSTEVHNYTYTVNDLQPGTHRFRLKQVDFNGAFEYSDVVEAVVTVPEGYLIGTAYPNPFSQSTTLEFGVETAQYVTVEVYNSVGQRVATPYARETAANQMIPVWVNLSDKPSGQYIISIRGTSWSTNRIVTLNK